MEITLIAFRLERALESLGLEKAVKNAPTAYLEKKTYVTMGDIQATNSTEDLPHIVLLMKNLFFHFHSV